MRFGFPKDSARPSYEDIATFVKSLVISIPDIDTVYRRAENHSVYLKFKCEKAFRDALGSNTRQPRFHYADGSVVVVEMIDAEGNYEYVRVCELPPELPDSDISLVLGRYGEVKRIVREKFPAGLGLDVFNGVRGVYMDVRKELPPALFFRNWRGNVFYAGNKEKCFACGQNGHQKHACPKKGRKHQGDAENSEVGHPSTYAGVLTGAASAQVDNETTAMLEIEVLDENVMDADEQVKTQEQNKEPEPSIVRCWKSDGKLYMQYAGVKEIRVDDFEEMQRKRDLEAKEARKSSPSKDKKHRNTSRLSSVGSKSDI